eukprot:760392-Hanusia_phi.AAC.2
MDAMLREAFPPLNEVFHDADDDDDDDVLLVPTLGGLEDVQGYAGCSNRIEGPHVGWEDGRQEEKGAERRGEEGGNRGNGGGGDGGGRGSDSVAMMAADRCAHGLWRTRRTLSSSASTCTGGS